jgi:hypothetical protein
MHIHLQKTAFSLLLSLSAAVCGFARAETVWFTVAGDPESASANTVQVDPTPVAIDNELRSMKIRVSRSLPRTNWEGVPYRSYVSDVTFDCVSNTARYTAITFYMQPLWQGSPHKITVYPPDQTRAMEFRNMEPNPTARIMKAACITGRPASN